MVRLWDLERGLCIRTYETHTGINALDITPDAGLCACANADGSLQVWDLAAESFHLTDKKHKYGINTVRRLNNAKIATGSLDRSLNVWRFQKWGVGWIV